MSEEQLNKEAEERYPEREFQKRDDYGYGYLLYSKREAFKAGYRSRDKEVEELLELLHEAFVQGCGVSEARYDHCCISTYEDIQQILIDRGVIKKEDCYRD